MASERQRPISWMTSASTLAQRRAMAPEERRERASTSAAVMPYSGPCWAAALRRRVVMERTWTSRRTPRW